jgi:Holliday junction resolvase RusA-like endonuclease
MRLEFVFIRDRDIDSGLKVLLDALSGYCYEDDKQIADLHVSKFVVGLNGSVKPRVLVVWWNLDSVDKDEPF